VPSSTRAFVEPFVRLVEGGEQGEFFADMKDYFYYSQIRSQGEDTTKARVLDGTLPAAEIPHLMCALGYFPTQLEIKNMTAEIKYSKFSETGEAVDRVGFEEFVKLYVNHRPVFAVGPQQIGTAFDAMKRSDEGFLARDTFIDLLTKNGENMTLEEIEDCFLKLVGNKSIEEVLPDEIDPYEFATNILGLSDLEEITGEQDSGEPLDIGQSLDPGSPQ